MMHDIDAIKLNFNPESLKLLNIIIGIIMYGVALDINLDDFKKLVKSPKAPLIGLFCQFLILPAIAFLFISVMNVTASVALGIILVASCPGGNLSNFFTTFSRGNTALSVTMSAISTLLSIIMTPFNLTFWGQLNPETASILKTIEISHFQIFMTILTILIIPSALGIMTKRKFPDFTKRIITLVHKITFLFFGVFVMVALKINFDYFLIFVGDVFWIVLFTNFFALLIGFASGRLFKLPTRDIKAISFEVGIQNSAFALILVFSFFEGLGGMAVVAAWWGIWHAISGGALSLGLRKQYDKNSGESHG
jgi:BASS family bile acid:Na+ symporter